jgi:ribosomal protein S12 methylthiotransferase accessory factor
VTVTRQVLNGRVELLPGEYDEDFDAELDALGRLYNPTTGPVTTLMLQRPDLLDLSMQSASCQHAPLTSLIKDVGVRQGIPGDLPIPASGKGADQLRPVLGALGEMGERLLAVLHTMTAEAALVTATYAGLSRAGLRALGPDELPLFAPEQYASPSFDYVPFTAHTNLRWIEGTSLRTDEPVLVPAQLVLMYNPSRFHEERIGYPTSGGLAFHRDRRRAVLHGFYEVVERDAIDVRWLCRLAPPRVDVDVAEILGAEWGLGAPRLATPAVTPMAVYLNTLDIPLPVLAAISIVTARQERTLLSGGGAWSDRTTALRQAVFELGQAQAALRAYQPTGAAAIARDTPVSQMHDFFDVALYYGFPENRSRLSWYMEDGGTVGWTEVPSRAFSDLADEYDAFLALLDELDLDPVVVDLDDACPPGVSLTKVIVPELTQAFIPSHPYLGHPRFSEFGSQLNADPVPFS